MFNKPACRILWGMLIICSIASPKPAFSQPVAFKFAREISIQIPNLAPKSRFRAISVNEQGEFYLVDEGLNRIFHLDARGRLLREVGGFGWGNNQFDRPRDIWANNGLDVFVADYNNNRIQRFDRNLNYVSSYQNDANLDPQLQFSLPVAVAFSRFGELFIAEAENHRVLRFNQEGQPEQSFGDFDWGAGTLEEPVALCISEKDEVFVADAMRQGVVKFDYYGNFLQEIRHKDLSQPGALVTENDDLFVADELEHEIFVFDTQGNFIVAFKPSQNAKPAARESFLDVAVLKNILYILDSMTKTIYCYQIYFNHR